MSDKIFEYHDESQSEKLARKTEESPFMVIGVVGMLAVVGFGAYKYKNRGNMSTSIYLMQLRVAAQGTAVAALSVGVVFQLYETIQRKYFKKNEP